jgi:hypothetical protein
MKVFVKKTLVALCIFAFVISGGLVYAVNTLSFHQSPSIPASGTNFNVLPSSITAGSDQSSSGLWTWDSVNHRFSAAIQITNNGNTAYTPSIVFSALTGWVGSTSTVTSIAQGATEAVTLYMTSSNPNPPAGPIGDFTVTIT